MKCESLLITIKTQSIIKTNQNFDQELFRFVVQIKKVKY